MTADSLHNLRAPACPSPSKHAQGWNNETGGRVALCCRRSGSLHKRWGRQGAADLECSYRRSSAAHLLVRSVLAQADTARRVLRRHPERLCKAPSTACVAATALDEERRIVTESAAGAPAQLAAFRAEPFRVHPTLQSTTFLAWTNIYAAVTSTAAA